MRVLLVAKPWRGGLAAYLNAALRERPGTEVEWIALAPGNPLGSVVRRLDREGWAERLTARIAAQRYDAAVFVNHLRAFRELPSARAHVLWLTDRPRLEPADYLPYRRVFVSDPGYAGEVREAAGDERFAGVLPFAMLPSVHAPRPTTARRRDACFVGNSDPKRDAHIAALLACGLDVTVVGNYFLRHPLYWRRPGAFRPAVANTRMGGVYGAHRLALNVHAGVVSAGTNMRTFECAGYGIPQLVEERPGLAEYFEPGREIATYREPAEIGEALARLLAVPATASRMAERARDRALAEHRYQHRIERLLDGLAS